MPRNARSGKPRNAQPRAPEGSPARGAVTVRMLVGPHAGQTVRVTAEKAKDLVGGWQPQAELVAVNAAETRETR